MTAVMSEGHRLQTAALEGPSLAQTIQFLSKPINVDIPDTLTRLWDESTPDDAENGYAKQARILSALLDRQIDRYTVSDAMEACNAIHLIKAGNCLTDMYGAPNTDMERDRWLDYEQSNLTFAAMQIGGNR